MRIRPAIALLLLLPALTAFRQADAERGAWNRPVDPFRIVGPVHYVGAAGVSAFLVATADGLILLDGGLPETAPLIAKSIAALGFRVEDVKYLLNSHAHFDHAGGLGELKRLTGAPLVASAADAPALRAGGRDMAAVPVDRVVADGDTVTLGGISMRAVMMPGHTKGCTSWSTTVEEGGRQYDVYFHCSTSVVDRLVGNTEYPAIVEDYERTFAKLRTTKADVFLSNHPSVFGMDDKRAKIGRGSNPFVDAAEIGRFAAESERQFRAALAKERR